MTDEVVDVSESSAPKAEALHRMKNAALWAQIVALPPGRSLKVHTLPGLMKKVRTQMMVRVGKARKADPSGPMQNVFSRGLDDQTFLIINAGPNHHTNDHTDTTTT